MILKVTVRPHLIVLSKFALMQTNYICIINFIPEIHYLQKNASLSKLPKIQDKEKYTFQYASSIKLLRVFFDIKNNPYRLPLLSVFRHPNFWTLFSYIILQNTSLPSLFLRNSQNFVDLINIFCFISNIVKAVGVTIKVFSYRKIIIKS